MDLTRRTLLTSAALAVPAAALVGQAPASAARSARTKSADITLAAFHAFMAERGFKPIVPLPLVGGPAATHGYTYDEGMTRTDWRNRRYVVQPCARVDDIAKSRKHGVLPLFTLAAFQTSPKKALPLTIAFLVDVMGLKRDDLTVTTIRGNPFLPSVKKAGLKRSQVILRDTAETKKAGDGSGWFIDPATGQGNPSMSVEYHRGSRSLEIAEGGLCMGLPDCPAHFGVGIERVTWAAAGPIDTWDDVLPRLLAYTTTVNNSSGTPLPAGYETFKAGL